MKKNTERVKMLKKRISSLCVLIFLFAISFEVLKTITAILLTSPDIFECGDTIAVIQKKKSALDCQLIMKDER